MVKHRYKVGDSVSIQPDRLNTHIRPGLYTITRTLPVTTGVCQYRARHAADTHERVFDEEQIAGNILGTP